MRLCPICGRSHSNANWDCPSCGYAPPNIGGFPALAPSLAEEGGGFQPELFEQLAALEADNFWFRARNQLIIQMLARHFPKMTRYLEIGCGTGYVLSGVATAFRDLDMTGSEIFSAGLEFASRRVPGAELLQMDARHLPYENHFEVIGAYDVLEHIVEDAEVLAEMHRALQPGGGIVLTVPQHPWLWSWQDEYACHVRRYTATELRRKVAAAGFTLVYQTSFVALLLPIMWLSRQQKHPSSEPGDPLSELRIGGVANRLLSVVMTFERGLIRSGIRFPVGGSLLLVATRGSS